MPRSRTKPKLQLYTCAKCSLEYPEPPRGAILGAKGMQTFCTDCWAEVEAHGWDDDVATNALKDPEDIIETIAPIPPSVPCNGCLGSVPKSDALITLYEEQFVYWHPECAPGADDADEDDADDPTSVFHNTGNVIHFTEVLHPGMQDPNTIGEPPICDACEQPIDTTTEHYYEWNHFGFHRFCHHDCSELDDQLNRDIQNAFDEGEMITHNDPEETPDDDTDTDDEESADEQPPPPTAPLPPIVAVLSADTLTNYKHREIAQKAIREHFGLAANYLTTSNIRHNKTDYIIFSEQASGRGQLTKAEKATIEPLAAETHAILRTLLQGNLDKYGTEFPTSQMRVSLDVLADYGMTYHPQGLRTTVRQWLDKRPNTRKPLTAKMKDDWTSLFITTLLARIPTDEALRPHIGTRYESITLDAVPPRTETTTTWGYWNGTEHKSDKPGYDRDSYVYCQRPTATTVPAQPSRRITRYVTSTPLGPLYTELITEDA